MRELTLDEQQVVSGGGCNADKECTGGVQGTSQNETVTFTVTEGG
jgi:hypothetical protein